MKIKDKILIVEDEANISGFIAAILAANGYDTMTAGTGSEAISMITSHCPDLILLDLGLPDMDGGGILQFVREWSTCPIIVVSARNHERDLIIVGAVFLTDDLTPEINTIDQNVEYENLEEVELKEEKDVLIETVKEETTQNKKYSEKIDSKLDKIPSKSNSSNMLDENKTMIVDDNHIFNLAETPGLEAPQFPGGEEALLKYISENIRYPAEAIENNIQGRVVVQFVVTKTGAVSEVRVLRGKYPDIDREAVRVVKSFPKFIPGRMNGHAVNVWYSLPIQFKLSGI